MKTMSFMSDAHHLFKITLTKCIPMNGSLKGAALCMEKSHDQLAVHKEGTKWALSGPLLLTHLKTMA